MGIFCAIAYTAIFMGLLYGMSRIVAVFAILIKLSHMFSDLMYLGVRCAAAVVLLNFGFRKTSSSWSEALSLKRFSGWLLLPMIVAAAGFGILNPEAGRVPYWFFALPDRLVKLFSVHRRAPPIELLSVVGVTPLIEEAVFRGLILGGLLRRYSAPTAILVSAVLFALFHRNPFQLVGAFFAGLLAGWIYVRTRSLWPCVIFHALINLKPTLVTMGAFPWMIPGYSARLPPGLVQPLWLDTLGAELTAIGLIGLALVFRRRPAQNIPQVNA
jgi:membrane protease YdiL (CAAX protease family)